MHARLRIASLGFSALRGGSLVPSVVRAAMVAIALSLLNVPCSVGAQPAQGRTSAGEATRKPNSEAFRKLREAIDNYYSYRDMRRVNWDQLFRQHESVLLAAASPEAFAEKAAAMLAAAKDLHITVSVEGGRQFGTLRQSVPANYDDALIARLVPKFQKHNSLVATGQFPDGIAYLQIRAWDTSRKDELESAFRALAQWQEAPGLLIDVRQNGGGGEGMAESIAGCFVDQPAVYAKHVSRDPRAPGGFTPIRERVLDPNTQQAKYRGAIAVLMGPRCVSSNEAFLLMMKQVPQCTLVGERSRGSSGNPKPHKLGNGVTVNLPSWKALRPDGTCFEGEGLSPDVRVATRPTDFQKRDPVLDAALRILRRKD